MVVVLPEGFRSLKRTLARLDPHEKLTISVIYPCFPWFSFDALGLFYESRLVPSRVGFSDHPASGLRCDHHGPRVLGSGWVVLSHPSVLLRPDPPVSPTPAAFPEALVIPQVFARRPGLGCLR